MINRERLVNRHNPRLKHIDFESPLSVGNGDLAYTVDITGMQTIYNDYREHHVPLCTMSQWGWHTEPVNEEINRYTMNDLEWTHYDYNGKDVTYAVEMKKGNEAVYNWLRENPHRLNLVRIGFIWESNEVSSEDISEVHQELKLYEGIIESSFMIHDSYCKVKTVCDFNKDTLGFQIESPALAKALLKVRIEFPYGSSGISASDWGCVDKHKTTVYKQVENQMVLKRQLDEDGYYTEVLSDDPVDIVKTEAHTIEITALSSKLSFSVHLAKELREDEEIKSTKQVFKSSQDGWKTFWERGAAIELCHSKDKRASELERRIILSQYLMAIQSSGSAPPQETGLTCNSWYGKFHLEMHLWHSAYLPLWQKGDLLEKSLSWYKEHLPEAQLNASRNGFKGARWPKMVANSAIDSPSTIATLLIWQQPHIIYMLELLYAENNSGELLENYWEVIKETADFMCDFAVYNENTGKYDLKSPIIPAQEEHDPRLTMNPTFELEYWRFTLRIAVKWGERLNHNTDDWGKVAENMAELSEKDGLYLAHEKCPRTFEAFNKDHPSMLGAYGLISSDRVMEQVMGQTLDKVLECWDFTSMWGWDFALMSMTAVRLGKPELAIDILMKDSPKNSYVTSGNNYQKLRKDLPLYLPGNGSLLLAVALMVAGYNGCKEALPGFPNNGMWTVEYENMLPLPY